METSAPWSDKANWSARLAQPLVAQLDAQQGHLFGWVPVALATGIGIYFALSHEPALSDYISLTLLLGVLAFLPVVGVFGPVVQVVLRAGGLITLGLILAAVRAQSVAAPVLEFRYYGPIEGRVVAIDRSSSNKMRLTLDQVRLRDMPPDKYPAKIRVSLHGEQGFIDPQPGARVMMTGHLQAPSGPVEPGGFDFQRHTWFQQLGALGYTRTPALLLEPAPERLGSWGLWIYAQRLRLSAVIKERMQGEEGPFAAAIITGDRAGLDPEAVESLRASNLAHLLAISGLHMGLLSGAVFASLRFLLALPCVLPGQLDAKKIAAGGALAAAAIYLALSGASIATQRAFIMVSIMLLAVMFEQRAISLRSVAIAASVILLLAPQTLISPGFQMSFAATVALVAVFGCLRDNRLFYLKNKFLRGVGSLVLSSMVAGAATAPFGAAHFNQLAHYGLLANFLSVPVMGFVVMPGALLAAVLSPIGAEFLGLEMMRLGLDWILGVARFVQSLEHSLRYIKAPGPWVLPLMSFGGVFICLWNGPLRWAGAGVIVVALGMWQLTLRPEILISESGRLVGVMGAEGRVLNKEKGDGFAARVWLENDGNLSTQQVAARRAQPDSSAGFTANAVDVRLGAGRKGGRVILDARNGEEIGEILAQLCQRADYLIVPRYQGRLPQGCRGSTAQSLRISGAISIDPEPHGLKITTAAQHQGQRLWSPSLRNSSLP